MSFSRWLALIGLLVGIGMLKVAQETSLALDAYRTGRDYTKLHDLETDTRWLETKVIALQSPIALVSTMKERHVQLVAWSRLSTPLAIAAAGRSPTAAPIAQASDASAARGVQQLAKDPQPD